MVGVIDVGSNSIRLMMWDGERAVSKELIVARIAEGLAISGRISEAGIERGARAIATLVGRAKEKGASEIFIFATEAVRASGNGGEFVERVADECGIEIEVVGGECEAELGFLGAYTSGRVGIIDVGGASTELVVGDESGVISAKSAKVGVMRLLDLAGESRDIARGIIAEKMAVYDKDIAFDTLIGIGGTATSLASIALELEPYDREIVNGYILTLDKVEEIIARLAPMTIEERQKVKGLMKERASVIVSGAYILSYAMEKLGKSQIRVSEGDNLEGFILKKQKNKNVSNFV